MVYFILIVVHIRKQVLKPSIKLLHSRRIRFHQKMSRIHQRKTSLYISFAAIGLVLILNVAIFGRRTYSTGALTCLDDSRISFNESGVIDMTSQWKKLGLATYVFSSYLDDRGPCSAKLTVLGFGEKSESPISGTLLLGNGVRIRLGDFEERKKLNPTGEYTLGKLGPYAYLWSLPGDVTANSLRFIILQQRHVMTGRTEAQIPITIPLFSTKTFGVCIDSPIFGPVKAKDIIETIEVNKVLGAEWFTFYMYDLDKALQKVLHEYANEGTVEVIENWGKGLPGGSTHYFGQTLSINECVYRNMHRVKYLVYTDLDEFIVPKTSLRWEDMMKKIENFQYGTYLFRHAYFLGKNNSTAFKTIERETYFTCNGSHHVKFPKFLTHITRSKKIYPPKEKSKYILRPLFASIVGVHEIFKHSEDHIQTYFVSADDALLHHLRQFKGGLHPMSSSVLEDLKHHEYTPDERALVYERNIVTALRRRLCHLYELRVTKQQQHDQNHDFNNSYRIAG